MDVWLSVGGGEMLTMCLKWMGRCDDLASPNGIGALEKYIASR